jgi:phosphate-selective porin OprO/OprP
MSVRGVRPAHSLFIRRWLVARGTAALAVVFARAGPAIAQTTALTAQPPAPAAPPVVAGWNEGFFIQTPNGDNRLQIGFILQADGRFALDDPLPTINTFMIRKARPVFTGRVARFFDFKIMPELAGASVQLLDGYFDIRFSPKLRLRSGKDKTPVGYEMLISDTALIFPERSVVSLLVPNRDVGFQAQGELAGGKLLYSAGIFNGNPVDGANSMSDDTNNAKDLAGRVVWMPFRSAETPPHTLNNFGVHLGGSTGNQSGALPTYRTSAGQTFFSYPTTANGASATTADGGRNRVSPAVFLYLKSFGGFAEYARTTQDIATSGVHRTVTNQAWGITASYVLTGEPTSDRGVRPKRPFDPGAGTWGAVQVAARYAELTLDEDLFTSGIVAATASRKAQQMTFNTNWFLNNYVKIYATYERFTFTGGARADENLILFRMQLAF